MTVDYDIVVNTDLLNQRFHPQTVLNIMRKLLRPQGQGIMVMPENKQQAKQMLELVDKAEFKIDNMLLTAQEYADSPLLNKL